MTTAAASRPRVAVEPAAAARVEWLADAVEAGGGEVVTPAEAQAVVWADHADAPALRRLLDDHPGIRWVQLPWAGIEPFVGILDHDRVWTCGKGVYADPVAEHALGLALAGMRHLIGYARATSWSAPSGRNLLGARVTVLGGGGITASLLHLLAPFETETTVVRRRDEPFAGASRTVGPAQLHEALATADLVVLALALTTETERIIGADELAAMPDHAWLVNVARGRHVDTDALVDALRAGRIAGAALDVTDPEPLPDGHPLWSLHNVLLTPHVGNTPEMAVPLLFRRVRDNVRRFAAGQPLIGPVDVDAGY